MGNNDIKLSYVLWVGRVDVRTYTVIEKIWSAEGEYYEVIAPGTEGQKPSFPNTAHVHSASNSVPPALFPERVRLPTAVLLKQPEGEENPEKTLCSL